MKKKKFWEFRNEADGPVELLIYGQLVSGESWFDTDVAPKEFADDLKECAGKDILLRINSPGGDVFAAQAIYNLLKAYKGKVTAHIDGICASAATLVACAADSVVMPKNAIFMIHNPQTMVISYMDEKGLTKLAGIMDKIKDTIVGVYASRCGSKSSVQDISDMMDEETWMSAEDAMGKGFADEIDEDYDVHMKMENGSICMNAVSMPLSEKGKLKMQCITEAKENKKEMTNGELISKIQELLGIGVQAKATEPAEDPKVVAERQRVKALDEMKAKCTNKFAIAFIDKCKETGKTAEEAKPFVETLSAIKDEPSEGARIQAIGKLIRDNMDSGAEGVSAAPASSGMEDAAKKKQADITDVVNRINRIRGIK